MDKTQNILNFDVTFFGDLIPISPTVSKTRCRIFYKGENRNSTFISDEFAEKLIGTVAFSPVKGIYEEKEDTPLTRDENGNFVHEKDFGGHRNGDGTAYGFVPKDFNFAWEKHTDPDGVERLYACVDVYLWTALYQEAKDIPGKKQSMELYEPSIKGRWLDLGGRQVYMFKEGSFLGLQVLGDDKEPCFEGSGFYTLSEFEKLQKDAKALMDEVTNYQAQQSLEDNEDNDNNNGGEEMKEKDGKLLFELSFEDKDRKISQALNPSEDYEQYAVATYEDYVIAYNWKETKYFRIEYSFDANEEVVLGEKVEVYVEYLSKENKAALDSVKSDYGQEFTEIKNNFEQKIVELEGQKATFETKVKELEGDIESLSNYQKETEDAKKEAVIDKYSVKLSEEVINDFKAKVAEYEVEDLEKDLKVALVDATPSLFTLDGEEDNEGAFPNDTFEEDGLESILLEYSNKVNNKNMEE